MSKDNSYEKINYYLRPKKQIERKIIVEILSNLSPYFPIRDYHYFGMGSINYIDFIMFHKYLGITRMTSVDYEKNHEKRFKYNKPYDFIKFKIYDSHSYLANELNWEDNNLIWLDYDSGINEDIISDLTLISGKANSGDVFLVTINNSKPRPDAIKDFIKKYKQYLPSTIKKNKIKEDYEKIVEYIFVQSIKKGLSANKDIFFFNLFNFQYKDGAPMYTYGGIFCIKEELEKIKKQFIFPDGEDRIIIDCPILTFREKMFIDSKINIEDNCKVIIKDNELGFSKKDLESYCRFYKYYPQYFEVLI